MSEIGVLNDEIPQEKGTLFSKNCGAPTILPKKTEIVKKQHFFCFFGCGAAVIELWVHFSSEN